MQASRAGELLQTPDGRLPGRLQRAITLDGMNLANIPLAAKVYAGAVAAAALLGGGIAAGIHIGSGTPSAAAAAAPVVASPTPSQAPAGTAKNGAAQAVRKAALQAEAQVLGISTKQLNADFKSGTTVQQLAAGKGLSQDQFRAQLLQAVRPLLDQEVAAGTLTSAQEQEELQRLGTTIPNWSQVGGAKRPSPSPSPAG